MSVELIADIGVIIEFGKPKKNAPTVSHTEWMLGCSKHGPMETKHCPECGEKIIERECTVTENISGYGMAFDEFEYKPLARLFHNSSYITFDLDDNEPEAIIIVDNRVKPIQMVDDGIEELSFERNRLYGKEAVDYVKKKYAKEIAELKKVFSHVFIGFGYAKYYS